MENKKVSKRSISAQPTNNTNAIAQTNKIGQKKKEEKSILPVNDEITNKLEAVLHNASPTKNKIAIKDYEIKYVFDNGKALEPIAVSMLTQQNETITINDEPTINDCRLLATTEDWLLNFPHINRTAEIAVNKRDIECLKGSEYLNDSVIDLYMRFINHQILNRREREKIVFLQCHFYYVLSTKKGSISSNYTDANKAIPIIDKNIFEKDFIFVPICENDHWFLAVICFPNKCCEIYEKFKTKEKELDAYLNQDQFRPCILIFDSLGGNRNANADIIREFLRCAWSEQKGLPNGAEIFSKKMMICHNVKCSRQTNSYDCGVYVILFSEYFITNPIQSFKFPITECQKWAPLFEAQNKRYRIHQVIYDMIPETADINQLKIIPTPKKIEYKTVN